MAENRSLEGHVAIVTGASCGVGKEIAIHLAQKGAKLVINYVENVEKEEEVASIINGDDCTVLKAITCKANVSKASKMSSLFDGDEESFRKNAHILVNCAGAFLCCRESTNRLIKGGGGWIINITSSIVGSLRPGHTSYAINKAVVDTMTKILARELRGANIKANCVALGPVATDMFFKGKSEVLIECITKEGPLEWIREVNDVEPKIGSEMWKCVDETLIVPEINNIHSPLLESPQTLLENTNISLIFNGKHK
ncbi:hypothetical protein KI387_033746 [Taxus chinensis]|uniref:Uncharacterized protein n=1 Tax=Taxus chinensis TaxID=29808 RepID=A0AA38F270_TAXCH|nr:hypothetical protein KI387_033746 [Taxus chinensis]